MSRSVRAMRQKAIRSGNTLAKNIKSKNISTIAKGPQKSYIGVGYPSGVKTSTPVSQTNNIGTAFAAGIHMRGYKKGGKIDKTGPAIVHKGERVLTKAQQKKISKALGRNYS